MIPKPTMDGMKKSDEAVVPMKAANKGAQTPAERRREGPQPRGIRETKAVPDAGTGERVTGGQADTASCNEKAAGETDCAPAPHHDGCAAVRLLRLGRPNGWRGWSGVEGVRGRTGRATARPARTRTFRSVWALPSRRVAIPKPDGGTRPLGNVPLWRTKLSRAVVDVILTPIYEPEFLGFSYGFRPGRGAHDALDALAFGIERRKVNG